LENENTAEYFVVEEKTNEMVYARPIELTADCLVCHGDPATSASKNGKDLLGFRMEGWHAGDIHGAFVLRAKLDRVDAVVKAGMMQALYWILPLSRCIGGGVYWLMARIKRQMGAMIHSISQGSAQMKEAIAQVSAANQALAQGASQQAASLEETSASGEQIAAITRKNADSARLAAEEMDLVDRKVHDANGAVAEMSGAMKQINSASGQIAGIIKVIDEIAFQTNILALNAAVEAARAGAAGAGFAVVAGEVRSLAQRSAKAAHDTGPLIEESVARSSEGSAKLAHMENVIRAITVSTAKVKVAVDEVNQASQEQQRGMEQIARALVQMDQVTQTSAASAEETASACEELSAQTMAVNESVQGLQAVVGG
jgi:methyl-accepting chemotaxis protein